MSYQGILFDLIGTTVKEKNPTVIVDSFMKAFHDHHVPVDGSALTAARGRDKKQMIEAILRQNNLSAECATEIYLSFKKHVQASVKSFSPFEGAEEIFAYLKEKNVKVGLSTGMERDLFDEIFLGIGWSHADFDFIGIAAEIGRNRPHPDVIFAMIKQLGISDPSRLLKVGDTVADVREGKNAGVPVCAVLSGTQPGDMILSEKPDFVVNDLLELKELIHAHL